MRMATHCGKPLQALVIPVAHDNLNAASRGAPLGIQGVSMETISRISSMLETGTVLFLRVCIQLHSVLSVTNLLCVPPARELTLEAAQSAGSAKLAAKLNYPSRTLTVSQIKKLLESRNDREVLDGMRRVISVCVPPASCCRYIS